MPDGSPQENWLLRIGDADCNIFTGPTGQEGHLSEGSTADAGPRAAVRLKCAWADRNVLRAGLLGTVDYQGGTIVRTPPYAYPVAPLDAQPLPDGARGMYAKRLFCTSVPSVEGVKWASDPQGTVTGTEGWGYFTYAIVTAEFTSPPYLIAPAKGPAFDDLVDQTYCVSKLRVSGEVFSPPTGSYVWTEGERLGKPVNDAHIGLIRPRYELSVTRIRMPIVPTQTLDSMIGTINATTIQVGNNTISPDAAMFMGYNPEPYSDPYNGGIVYNIEMLWLINGFIEQRNADGNWNWFVDPVGDWSAIGQNIDASPKPGPFAEAEHNDLFSDSIS